MKAWILAAIVAGVLVLVGVPAVALALSSHGTSGQPAAAEPKKDHSEGPDEHPPMWKDHGRGWGPPGWAHGHGHPPFALDKLTAKQRKALADRLDQRATELHKAASCLRQNGDPKACLKNSFKGEGFSRPPQQG